VSGNVQVSDGGLSSQVGFNVTTTTTFGMSDTVDIPAHVNVTIQIGAKWYDYRVAQREYTYLVRTGACISWIISTVYATVHKYDTRAFRNIDSQERKGGTHSQREAYRAGSVLPIAHEQTSLVTPLDMRRNQRL
jgi:hypothetical protein